MNKYGGVLLICKSTNRFLLLKRNEKASYPKTWSIVSGGIEEGESPLEGIKRELKEEEILADILEFKKPEKYRGGLISLIS